MLQKQGGVCPICQKPIDLSEKGRAVMDHDHRNGRVRGTLCRPCNGMEGKVANAVGRWGGVGMDYNKIIPMLRRLADYLCQEPYPVLYPFHKTEEELRLDRNKKAREARAKARAKAAMKKE
ncbi:putative endonuclease [Achromobacter phage vB_AxyP_19-32_Axy09]|uniref:Putative endonuclease n=1 Tax=Achromobacter phage vB_AxyP_19-32_Axy09 TaxID=2591040 RepID=A0A514CTT2_9CAUD|nr:putative endonuclease [Achromobacter phage vB_AxyP_19-32_Axy09]